GERQRRRAADKDVDMKRHAAPQRQRVMHADAAMNLVVQPDFAVGMILVAGKLDPIHAEIGLPPTGTVRVFGVDLRQRSKRPSVPRPTHKLWQLMDRRPRVQDWAAPNPFRPREPQNAGNAAITPRIFPERRRIDLQFNQPANGIQSVAEEEASAIERAKEITDHRKSAAFDPREIKCGTAGL